MTPTRLIRHGRLPLRVSAWLLSAAALLSVALAQTGKRPLNHRDYNGWRTIAGTRLSGDGKFLAYGVFPQEGPKEAREIAKLVGRAVARWRSVAARLGVPAAEIDRMASAFEQ